MNNKEDRDMISNCIRSIKCILNKAGAKIPHIVQNVLINIYIYKCCNT